MTTYKLGETPFSSAKSISHYLVDKIHSKLKRKDYKSVNKTLISES